MNIRPTTLTFTEAAEFLPPGLPLEVWEVAADNNCTFEIEPTGKLVRKDRLSGTRWYSTDMSGLFTILNLPRHSNTENVCTVYLMNGRVTKVTETARATAAPLVTADWRWALDELDVDNEAEPLAKSYVGCMQLIAKAEATPGYKSGSNKVDGMIGVALCRPNLLHGLTAREVLSKLDDHQLRALSNWHKNS